MGNIKDLFTIALLALSTGLFAQDKQDQQDDIVAVWKAEETKVEIYKEGDRYLGNPISPMGERNTEIEVLNLKYNEGKWVGKIYSKKRGRLLDVACQVGGDKLLLKVTARFFSTDLEWIRAK